MGTVLLIDHTCKVEQVETHVLHYTAQNLTAYFALTHAGRRLQHTLENFPIDRPLRPHALEFEHALRSTESGTGDSDTHAAHDNGAAGDARETDQEDMSGQCLVSCLLFAEL